MNDLNEYVTTQDEDKIYIAEIIGKLLTDLVNICIENPTEYKEELEIMENVNKSSIDILKEETAVKSKLEEKFEIAKNLLDILDNTVIAMKTGLSLKQVEQLRAEV